MSRFLLNVGYLLLAVIATPFVVYRRLRHGKRTPALMTKWTGRIDVPAKTGPRVWLHAVSVGEVLQVRPLIRELRTRRPDLDVVLSSTTAAGLLLAREKYADCHVVPFPFDVSWSVSRAFERIQPDAVGLVELELWPNFIAEADRRDVPLLIANGRLSEKSHRGYAKFCRLAEPMFQRLTAVCVQNETYAGRFADLGVAPDRLHVTGSIKFDGLATDRSRSDVLALRDAFGFTPADRVFMAGSTHDPEEAIALDAWQQVRVQHPDVKLLLVPRHPERFDVVAEAVTSRGLTLTRRSNETKPASTDVYLLDTVGELSACWGLADVAFVGGTLTQRGGQNMLEPAAYGCPVVMGPNVWNFADIAAGLLDAGGAVPVTETASLVRAVTRLFEDAEQHTHVAAAATGYAASQSGAAARTAETLVSLLQSAVPSDKAIERVA